MRDISVEKDSSDVRASPGLLQNNSKTGPGMWKIKKIAKTDSIRRNIVS